MSNFIVGVSSARRCNEALFSIIPSLLIVLRTLTPIGNNCAIWRIMFLMEVSVASYVDRRLQDKPSIIHTSP